MTEHTSGYAVFFHEQALEALGEPIKPYVKDGPMGPHVPCREVDTGGAFVELTLQATGGAGEPAQVEMMIPMQMVRLIVSTRSDSAFGFAARHLEPGLTALPVVGPDAPAADAPSAAMPHATPPAHEDDRRLPPEG